MNICFAFEPDIVEVPLHCGTDPDPSDPYLWRTAPDADPRRPKNIWIRIRGNQRFSYSYYFFNILNICKRVSLWCPLTKLSASKKIAGNRIYLLFACTLHICRCLPFRLEACAAVCQCAWTVLLRKHAYSARTFRQDLNGEKLQSLCRDKNCNASNQLTGFSLSSCIHFNPVVKIKTSKTFNWIWFCSNGLWTFFEVCLTLFCSDILQLALTRIRITPAWPYLAAVWTGVSPY